MEKILKINNSVTILFPQKRPMEDKILSNLFTYWEGLRQGRDVPARAELDPRAIKGGIEHTFILELSGPEDCRFRIAGSKVSDLLGLELRSMPARSLIDPVDRGRFDACLTAVLEKAEVAELRLNCTSASQANVLGRMLLMPMSDDHGNITRIFGGITIDTPLITAPMRFSIRHIRTKRIVTGIETEAPSTAVGFSEAPIEFQGKKSQQAGTIMPANQASSNGSTRPYLQLVKDE